MNMERPERPRRHKSVSRQNLRMSHSRSSCTMHPFDINSNSDQVIDVTEVGSSLTPRSKRTRHFLADVPTSRRIHSSSFVNSATYVPSVLMPMPIPLPRSSQGGSIEMTEVPIKTENSSTISSGSSVNIPDAMPGDPLYSRYLLQTRASASRSSPSGSQILQEIDDICFFPPRRRLTGRRRLHSARQNSGVQNEMRDAFTMSNPYTSTNSNSTPYTSTNSNSTPYTSTNSNNTPYTSTNSNSTYVMSESPLSPPPVDTGLDANEEQELIPIPNYNGLTDPILLYSRDQMQSTNCSRGDLQMQPTSISDIMHHILIKTEPQQRLENNQNQQNFHNSPFYQPERSHTNSTQPSETTRSLSQPASPVSGEPHSPNTLTSSPVINVYGSPESEFSPASSPNSPAPQNNSETVVHENTNEAVRGQLVSEWETSEEDTSNEETPPINEVIVLDTPEGQNPGDTSNSIDLSPTEVIVDHVEETVSSAQLDSTMVASPSHTPPLPVVPTNVQEVIQKDVITATDLLKKLNQNLVSLLECPVCLDFMVPPILQCNKGHLVCEACRPKLTVCPTCRSRFAERNLAMEKVAEKLMYPCKNVITGCKVTLKLKDKAKHEQLCGFRHFDCIVGTCEWKGYKPELIVHLSLAHDEKLVIGNEKKLLVPFINGRNSWIFYTFDEVFLLSVVAESINRKFSCCVQLIGAPEKASKFFYCIKLERTDPYMSAEYCHETHSDESKAMNLIYSNKGITMDCTYVKQYAIHQSHRRIPARISIRRAQDIE